MKALNSLKKPSGGKGKSAGAKLGQSRKSAFGTPGKKTTEIIVPTVDLTATGKKTSPAKDKKDSKKNKKKLPKLTALI